jgi:hypothetical protein
LTALFGPVTDGVGGVEGGVGQQTDQVRLVDALIVGEVAAGQDAAIGLDGDGADGVVETGPGIEGEVQCAVGVESSQAVAGDAIDLGEGAADEDLAVGLHGHGLDAVVGVSGRMEGRIGCSVRQQSGDAVAVDSGQEAEIPAHQESAFRGRCQAKDRPVGAQPGVTPVDHALAGGIIIVEDYQDRVALAAQLGATGWIAQAQQDRFVVLGQGILQNGDGEGGGGLACGKAEGAGCGQIIGDGGGSVGGAVIDLHGLGAGAQTHHLDGGGAGAFEDLEPGLCEPQGATRGAGRGQESGQARAIEFVDLGEVSAHDHAIVGLGPEGAHGVVGAHADGKGRVDGAFGQESDQAVVGIAGELGEAAADEDFAVRLNGQRLHAVVGGGADRQAGIGQSLRGEPNQAVVAGSIEEGEAAADQDATVGLEEDHAHFGIRSRSWVERGVGGAAGQAPRQAGPRLTVDLGEVPAEQEVAVGLEGEGVDGVVRSRADGVGRVEVGIGQQTDQVRLVDALIVGKVAADQDAAVGLDGDGADGVVETGPGIEGEVQCAVGVESSQAVAGDAIDQGEGAADEDLAVGLHGHGLDRVVQSDWLKGAIDLAGLQESNHVHAGGVVHRREIACDQELSVRLTMDRVNRSAEPGADVKGRIGISRRCDQTEAEETEERENEGKPI